MLREEDDKIMLDAKFFDDVAKRLSDAVPPGIKHIQEDLQKNFHAILQAAFAKLDLVTREEFDVQAGVLARTRAKLEKLEKRLTELETPATKPSRKPHKPTKPDELL